MANKYNFSSSPIGNVVYDPVSTSLGKFAQKQPVEQSIPGYVKTKIGIDATIGLTQGFLTGLSEYDAYQAKARALDNQSKLNFYSSATKRRYSNYVLGLNMQGLFEYENQMEGAQMAQMAASGQMDVTTGDKRLTADTARQVQRRMLDLNTSAYINSFEEDKQAILNYIADKYQAKMAKTAAKYSLISGIAGGISNAVFSAIGTYAGYKYQNAASEANAKNIANKVVTYLK